MSNSVISNKARIGSNFKIGNFSVIEDDVVIGDNVEIGNNVTIANGARIANGVKISHGAVIATQPQDLKFSGEVTTAEIGEGTVIREYVTVNRGTKYSNKVVVGKNCFIMAYVHVAHDCIIGDNVILANSVQMGGHVEIDDYTIIGGLVGIHQFVKIGKQTMIAAHSMLVKDVPPYIVAGNDPVQYEGINHIGLKRRGFTSEQLAKLREVYEIIYNSGLNVSDAVKKAKSEIKADNNINDVFDFIEKRSTRGIIRGLK
ncbi:MAG TPA: acyl-ACP--UDP-N-acetylglucosamine O-acyltransferase [Ignavibacteria bacterium]|nr:acyl-ACP--UDP-N-acetylglucosamine O-acyltransferase [Ignavibacteria bacterium]